jgi:hypothetical protein
MTQWTGTEHKNMEKVFLGVLASATDPAVIRAVQAILDFIYYAHFETHTDKSLCCLDEAWATFHKNKKVFQDLLIRNHFNISKLHNIKHYVDSIRSRGTADGFNTEGTERLHIDLAKLGYRASNKKAYIKQMTIWLTRQEAVQRFCAYLQWAIPSYRAQLLGEVDEPLDDAQEKDEGEKEKEIISTTSYTIAKKPPLPNVPISSISEDYGAKDFLLELNKYLQASNITPSIPPTSESSFPVYKQVTKYLPFVPEATSSMEPIRDTIHAIRSQPGKVPYQASNTQPMVNSVQSWFVSAHLLKERVHSMAFTLLKCGLFSNCQRKSARFHTHSHISIGTRHFKHSTRTL